MALLLLLLLPSRFSRVWLCATPKTSAHQAPRPWDSPGKNTGVGCRFLLQCMNVKSESEGAQLSLTQQPHGLQPTRLIRPCKLSGKSTGVGCHCLLWKWTGMGEFNSDDHYIYYGGQESLRRNGVTIIVNKNPKMQYLDAISKMTEWSLFISKANQSMSH